VPAVRVLRAGLDGDWQDPAWTLRTVAAILANPRYTGMQLWNRQRTDFDLADPANTGLGHKQCSGPASNGNVT
jgi:hypothetical protein